MGRFSTAGGSSYFKPKEHAGDLTLFEALGVLKDYVFPGSKDAPRDAMRANVFVLKADGSVAKFFDQTIQTTNFVSAMRQAETPFVLGRVEMGDKAWLLKAPSSADEARAEAFLDSLEADSTSGVTAPDSGSPAPY